MMGGETRTNYQSPSAVVVDTGLVEDVRKRGRGKKKRCVQWDRIEIDGRGTIIPWADASTAAPSALLDITQDRRKPDPSEKSSHLIVPTERTTCNMCLATTESSSMSREITMKHIPEARRKWDVVNSSEGGKFASASYLYDSAKLCTLCSQFFCSNKGGEQGGSPLTLETMASNEPLPESTAKLITTAPRKGSVMEDKRQHQREHSAIDPAGGNRSPFSLDELIADDDEGLIVKEVDLARLLGATAVQSSTADGMTAGVCVGHSIIGIMHGGEAEGGIDDIHVRGTVRPTTSRYDDCPVNGNSIAPPGPILDPTRVQSVCGVTVTVEGDRSMIADSKARRSMSVVAPVTATAFQASPTFLSPRMSPQESIVATARTCSRTRREAHPWWELNLGNVFPVRCIRVTHPNRRMEGKKAGALSFVDVAPFWIMVTAGFIGECTPEKARELAVQSKRWGSHGKKTVWELGVNCFATGVRIQAEGVKSLQLHRFEKESYSRLWAGRGYCV